MLKIQTELRAPKDISATDKNNSVRYKYRSVESLYEKIKPLLSEPLAITTALVEVGGRVFLEASATYKNTTAKGYAELENNPKNMSVGQATGAATSYAIKYALCMLFCVDNGEDLDGQKIEAEDKQPVKQMPADAGQSAVDIKRQLNAKMTVAGLPDSEKKAFFDTYCGNQALWPRILENFDRYLEEWRSGDKQRVMGV